METNSLRCLINSISRLVHLVSCQTLKCVPVQKDAESVARLTKHLKLILDQVDEKIVNDNALLRECENLDIAVNEAREFMERWGSKVGKIFLVWQMELLLSKIRTSSLEICCILCRLLQVLELPSTLACAERCMQQLQSCKSDQILRLIEQALSAAENDTSKVMLSSDQLDDVVDSLGLTSNQELLRESIAVEKQRMRAQANKWKAEVDRINRVVGFLAILRDHMMSNGYFDAVDGVQVPLYFRCPLSLEIMLDPVILASGQTFERASIQKWLSHGLVTCPQTHQPLSHTNIIPNYTIKALIVNWFEQNNLKLPCIARTSMGSPSSHLSSQNVSRTNSFRCSLAGSNSPSGSSHGITDAHSRQKSGNEPSSVSSSEEESSSLYQSKEAAEDQFSPEHSYTHSRTHSISSAVSSSTDFLPVGMTDIASISSKLENVVGRFSNEIRSSECSNSCSTANNASLSGRGSYSYNSSKSTSITEVSESRASSYRTRAHSFPVPDLASDEPTTSSHVEKLIEELKSHSTEAQSSAAAELRLLTKHSMENRVIIGKCGVFGPLISLLYSDCEKTQEHAVTALLNLSIHGENKARIAEAGVIEPIIHVLRTGNDASKENSAATLFSISTLEEQKLKIGRTEAVKGLVHLLATGTVRGKKDAATALFNLSICHENKSRIVQAGAAKPLVELLDDGDDSGFADKAAAVLANLSAVSEGRAAIAKAGGIPLIVELVESGSQRGKENAASILLQLCLNSYKFCNMVLQEGAVPPLVALSQSGSARAREKAQQLLTHFRSQREGGTSKKKVQMNS